MKSFSLRGRALDRGLSVRFFDLLVRSMVVVADRCASLAARLGLSDVGPLAIAVAPSVLVNRGLNQPRPARRRERLLTLELGSELKGAQPGRSVSAA